ncbi:epsin-2-like protein [Lates japonicus]|uniref:Epsin-2-like protein n=1 Tax=Lates japonicus TaxID=270547 RepID=A0AAD3R6V9_LATJO|nr:epsin-2-like protein [Lates japonicus]
MTLDSSQCSSSRHRLRRCGCAEPCHSFHPPTGQIPGDTISTKGNYGWRLRSAFKARGPVVRSGAVAGVSLPETSALLGSPFGSTLTPSHGAPLIFGAANPSSETPVFQLPPHTMGVSYSGFSMLQAAQVAPETGIAQPVSVGGSPQVGLNMNPPCGGTGMVQTGYPVGNPLADPLFLGTGTGQSSFFGGNLQAKVGHLGGSTPQAEGGVPLQPQLLSSSGLGETVSKNNNPFLF